MNQGRGRITGQHAAFGQPTEEDIKDMSKELGDVLWYVATMADHFGLSLKDIAQQNVDKLQDRKARGKIQGSGDNR